MKYPSTVAMKAVPEKFRMELSQLNKLPQDWAIRVERDATDWMRDGLRVHLDRGGLRYAMQQVLPKWWDVTP